MNKTILTPIDGSMHAKSALELSTDIAAKYDAELILLHVNEGDSNVPDELYDMAAHEIKAADGGPDFHDPWQHSKRQEVLNYLGKILLRDAQKLAEGKGVKRVESIMDFGDAGEQILHHAKHRDTDLIIMGSRGFGQLAGLVLGSASHKVFHLAPCTCVTVHSEGAQQAFDGIKNILVATDGSEQADKAVELSSEIALKYGAKLSLLYVTSRGPSLEQLRNSVDAKALSEKAIEELDPARHPIAERLSSVVMPPVVSQDVLDEIGQQVLERSQGIAEATGIETTNLLLKDGDPARVIVNFAEREQADLIALGSRGLGRIDSVLTGSVSYKVSHAANRSCMIVR